MRGLRYLFFVFCAAATIEACKERSVDSPESREMAPNSVIQTTQQEEDAADEPLLPESDAPGAELDENAKSQRPSNTKSNNSKPRKKTN